MKKQLRFAQIIAAPWAGENGDLTYSLYGLTDDGKVYRKQVGGWKEVPMNIWEEE